MKIAVGNDHRGVTVKQRLVGLSEGARPRGHRSRREQPGQRRLSRLRHSRWPRPWARARSTAASWSAAPATACASPPTRSPAFGAANCRDVIDAELSRRHNDANIMCLSADLIGEEQIEKMVKTWLTTDFEGGRHARRTEKIAVYEKDHIEEA